MKTRRLTKAACGMAVLEARSLERRARALRKAAREGRADVVLASVLNDWAKPSAIYQRLKRRQR